MESIGECLNSELERSIVVGLVQTSHLFGHKNLMELLAFTVMRVH